MLSDLAGAPDPRGHRRTTIYLDTALEEEAESFGLAKNLSAWVEMHLLADIRAAKEARRPDMLPAGGFHCVKCRRMSDEMPEHCPKCGGIAFLHASYKEGKL